MTTRQASKALAFPFIDNLPQVLCQSGTPILYDLLSSTIRTVLITTDETDEVRTFYSIIILNIKLEYLTWFYTHNQLEIQNLSDFGKDHLNGDTN